MFNWLRGSANLKKAKKAYAKGDKKKARKYNEKAHKHAAKSAAGDRRRRGR
jgi:hypothetical protein